MYKTRFRKNNTVVLMQSKIHEFDVKLEQHLGCFLVKKREKVCSADIKYLTSTQLECQSNICIHCLLRGFRTLHSRRGAACRCCGSPRVL